MIKPVNGHLLIEPVKHDGFIATQTETYQEIGILVSAGDQVLGDGTGGLKVGDKVYFDAWLAAKYPNPNGGNDTFYWLVKWADVRAVENVEQPA